MKHAIHQIHFVGIGGSGMSGIAEVLHNLGYTITGSDLADSAALRRLQALGIAIHVGHDGAHIAGADAVVTSTAVQADNPEVLAAREKKIPVVPRALMLAELLPSAWHCHAARRQDTNTSLVPSVLAGPGSTHLCHCGRLTARHHAALGQGDYIVSRRRVRRLLKRLTVMVVPHRCRPLGPTATTWRLNRLCRVAPMPFMAGNLARHPAVRRHREQDSSRPSHYGFGEVRGALYVAAAAGQMHFTVRGARASAATWTWCEPAGSTSATRWPRSPWRDLGLTTGGAARLLAQGRGRRFSRYGELPAKDGGHFTSSRLRPPPGEWRPRWRQQRAFQGQRRGCFSRTYPAPAIALRFHPGHGSADGVLLTRDAVAKRPWSQPMREGARLPGGRVERCLCQCGGLPRRIAENARAAT